MPLEINEIDIAMRVTDGDSERGRFDEGAAAPMGEIDREDLIEECVRRVLETLRTQREP
jgi:hypothetical protein